MGELEFALSRLAWRHRLQHAIERMAPWLAVGVGAAAAAVFVIRLALPDGQQLPAWLLVAALLISLSPGLMALRHRIPRWRLAGECDRLVGAEGVVMAVAAGGDHGWQQRIIPALTTFRAPPLRWRSWLPALIAGVCYSVAWFIPQVQPSVAVAPVGAALIAPVAARVAALEQYGLAPIEEVRRLQEDLKKLSEAVAASGMDPARWDALDRMDRRSKDAATLASRRLGDAVAAAAAAARLQTDAALQQTAATAAELSAAMTALAAAAPGLTALDPATAKALVEAAQAAVQAGALDPAVAQQLAMGLAKQLALAEHQPAPAPDVAKLGQDLAADLAKRRAALAGLADILGNEDGNFTDNSGENDGNGDGGVDRGPGHPELGKNDRPPAAVGTPEGLPAGAELDPDGSVTFATSIREPTTEEVAAAAQAAARSFDSAAADARRAEVAPRHRAAVAAYFAIPAAESGPDCATSPPSSAPARQSTQRE